MSYCRDGTRKRRVFICSSFHLVINGVSVLFCEDLQLWVYLLKVGLIYSNFVAVHTMLLCILTHSSSIFSGLPWLGLPGHGMPWRVVTILVTSSAWCSRTATGKFVVALVLPLRQFLLTLAHLLASMIIVGRFLERRPEFVHNSHRMSLNWKACMCFKMFTSSL